MTQMYEKNVNLISFSNYEVFNEKILNQIIQTRKILLLGSFNLQNIRLRLNNRYIKFSEILEKLTKRNVAIYILLQPRARKSSVIQSLRYINKNYKNLIIRTCSRVHLKTIIIDLKIAYIGSANITGFGLGTRSKAKRNFELGFITTDKEIISNVTRNFLDIFKGKYCNSTNCYYYKNSKSKRYCDGIIKG